MDRPTLKPLPPHPFVFSEWKFVMLGVDYHFAVDHHFYSAPYQLRGEELEARFTAKTVEADAILDRLVHNAYRIPLDGPSRRKRDGGTG